MAQTGIAWHGMEAMDGLAAASGWYGVSGSLMAKEHLSMLAIAWPGKVGTLEGCIQRERRNLAMQVAVVRYVAKRSEWKEALLLLVDDGPPPGWMQVWCTVWTVWCR